MKEESKEILGLINSVISKNNIKENIKETYGVVVVESGIIKIFDDFEIVLEIWKLYKLALALEDKEMLKVIMTETTSGGIIDIGLTVVDVAKILSMYPIYRFYVDDEEKQIVNVRKAQAIDKFLYEIQEQDSEE